mmetsp:Transcript_72026/g.156994  ORF Transcript_72026/g.156994 Transcript_72026/m.156994 type:complete len:100 (-) Transcript_72026:1569-1868(-)
MKSFLQTQYAIPDVASTLQQKSPLRAGLRLKNWRRTILHTTKIAREGEGSLFLLPTEMRLKLCMYFCTGLGHSQNCPSEPATGWQATRTIATCWCVDDF